MAAAAAAAEGFPAAERVEAERRREHYHEHRLTLAAQQKAADDAFERRARAQKVAAEGRLGALAGKDGGMPYPPVLQRWSGGGLKPRLWSTEVVRAAARRRRRCASRPIGRKYTASVVARSASSRARTPSRRARATVLHEERAGRRW